MTNNLAGTKRSSIVELVGTLQDGETIIQEFPMNHEVGTPESALLSHALTTVRGAGGMMTEGEKGTLNFYPMLTLKKIHLSVKSIVVVPSLH